MNSNRWLVRHLSLLCLLIVLSPASIHGADWEQDDFRWIHGANYVPSYSATDVEMWLKYDAQVIDRELAYAKKMGLNSVRVVLQSLVYHHDPKAFLDNFENFLSIADKHDLKVMPILFDSCFGVAPSLESRSMWVANPGPDRSARDRASACPRRRSDVSCAHQRSQRLRSCRCSAAHNLSNGCRAQRCYHHPAP